jgi:D-alanyl-D-alanine carboxypeptidase/D-alanyl-D-alanine-endopeptidase (penicillin-binding protein 4)
MSGVSTLAGYADTKSHGRVRFVIAMKGGGATRFQVLNAIKAGL